MYECGSAFGEVTLMLHTTFPPRYNGIMVSSCGTPSLDQMEPLNKKFMGRKRERKIERRKERKRERSKERKREREKERRKDRKRERKKKRNKDRKDSAIKRK